MEDKQPHADRVAQALICCSVGAYAGALTRGTRYTVFAENERNVRVRADTGHVRWFPRVLFAQDDRLMPTLVRWQYTQPVSEASDGNAEIHLQLSDGTWRWCLCVTPGYLHRMLADPQRQPPAIWAPHMIVIRSLSAADLQSTFADLDAQGELLAASRPFTPEQPLPDQALPVPQAPVPVPPLHLAGEKERAGPA